MKQTMMFLDTQRRNSPTFGPYDTDKVLAPLQSTAQRLNAEFLPEAKAIAADPNLTPAGKLAARAALLKSTTDTVTQESETRLAGLDADIASQQAALVKGATTTPDPRKVELMIEHLKPFDPQARRVLYNSGTDDEKMLMEAASALLGRIPTKGDDGGYTWKPLLDPAFVTEVVMARAAAQNPEGVAKLRALAGIRALHASFTGQLLADVRDTLGS